MARKSQILSTPTSRSSTRTRTLHDSFVAEVHRTRQRLLSAHHGNLASLIQSTQGLTVAAARARIRKPE